MERDIRKLADLVMEQNEEVPYFKETDDPYKISQMIVEEAIELHGEIERAFITDDMTQVAGELGDVLYLALKMCKELGFNPDDVIQMKILRNRIKYGGYHDGKLAKEEWEDKGGDKKFYEDFLTYLALVE